MEGNIDSKPSMMKDLINMMEVLLKYVNLPCAEIHNVVETLKRAFALKGNRFEIPKIKQV